MTLMELLKDLFGDKLDKEINSGKEEVDSDKKETDSDKKETDSDKKETDSDKKETDSDKKETDSDKKENDSDKKETDSGEEEKANSSLGGDNMIIKDGWYNADTGEIDSSKIGDPVVLEALTTLNNTIQENSNMYKIDSAITQEISKLNLNVTPETFKKLIDVSSIQVKEGEIVGLLESIDSIKSSDPGIFKEAKDGLESSPLNEGFDPVDKANDSPSSWDQAFAMQDANSQ